MYENESKELDKRYSVTRRQALSIAGLLGAAVPAAMAVAGAAPKPAGAMTPTMPENMSVNIPTAINYAARHDGTLVGPSASALAIKNQSDWEVRVKGVKAAPAAGWNIVDDASSSSDPNSVSLTLGPEADQLNLSDYTGDGGEVNDQEAWQMSSPNSNEGLSQVDMLTSGSISENTEVEDEPQQIGTTEWRLANDTTTNEVFQRITTLETELSQAQQTITELTAFKSQFAMTDVQPTDENAVIWYNTATGGLYAKDYVAPDAYTDGGWKWREFTFLDVGKNDVFNATADTPSS